MYKMLYQSKILPLIITFIISTAQVSLAQTKFTITGIVTDNETGVNIADAIIKINELPAFTTVTNDKGVYELKLPKGLYTIVVSHVGYKTDMQTINVVKKQTIKTSLGYDNQLSIIEINGNATRAERLQSTQMGVDHIGSKQMESVPVLFGEKDPVRIIQLLPGVKSSSNGTNEFVVRGGNADQNLILLDGATVYNPSHMLGFVSTFNSDAIKDLDFFKGNIPAQYGGRLSSILDIRSNEGNDKFGISGGIGLISSRLEINAPVLNKQGSFMVSARRTYADAFLKLSSNKSINSTIFHFYDVNAAFKYHINDNNSIHISAYSGSDAIGEDKSFGTNWGNQTATLRWDHHFNAGSSTTALVYSNYQYQIENFSLATAYDIRSQIKSLAATHDFKFKVKENHSVGLGLNVTRYMLNPGSLTAPQTSQYNSFNIEKRNGFELALYAADEWQVNPKLKFSYGLRTSSFLLNGPYSFNQYNDSGDLSDSLKYPGGKIAKAYLMLEPRIALSYSLNNNNSIKASYNRNSQNVHVLSNYSTSLPTDLYELSGPVIKPQKADQYSIGYYHTFNKKYDFSVESYYKYLMNQIDYKTGSNLFLNKDAESQIISGTGKAYGIEFLLKKNEGRLTGWLAFTLSRSERRFEQINDDQPFSSSFDRPYDLVLVAIYQLSQRLTVSGTFLYQTGTPITSPSSKYTVGGQTSFYYDTRNNDRLPVNSRADLSLTWRNKIQKRFSSNWALSIYNIYNRKNPYTVEYQQSKTNNVKAEAVQISLLGILPSASWNFKF